MTYAQIYSDPDGIIVNAVENDGVRDTNGYLYQIHLKHYDGKPAGVSHLEFQQGAPSKVGRNGFTNETLLAVLIHRTEALNGQVPCADNDEALEHMKKALAAFERRTQSRKSRGVHGTNRT